MTTMTTRELKEQLASLQGQEVTLQGWIRNHRKQKGLGFIDFYDGTCFRNPQVVYDQTIPDFEAIQALRVGAAIRVTGRVVPSYRDPPFLIMGISLHGLYILLLLICNRQVLLYLPGFCDRIAALFRSESSFGTKRGGMLRPDG